MRIKITFDEMEVQMRSQNIEGPYEFDGEEVTTTQPPCIDKKDLVAGLWYKGSAQSRYPVAMWTGKEFVSISSSLVRKGLLNYSEEERLKRMDHWSDGGAFEPILP